MDSDQPEFDVPRYYRFGYTDGGRRCDKLLAAFHSVIPVSVLASLPSRWRYVSSDRFLDRYGWMGPVIWATSYGSHLLLIGGQRVLRIWTDADNQCWVEAQPHVLSKVAIVSIPEKNIRKSKPFTYRTKITLETEMSALAIRTKMLYGI